MMYMYVLVKLNYVNESVYEIQCVCPSKEIAKTRQKELQEEIDPEYNEWHIEYYKTEVYAEEV